MNVSMVLKNDSKWIKTQLLLMFNIGVHSSSLILLFYFYTPLYLLYPMRTDCIIF
jgi:hypothetical protein